MSVNEIQYQFDHQRASDQNFTNVDCIVLISSFLDQNDPIWKFLPEQNPQDQFNLE